MSGINGLIKYKATKGDVMPCLEKMNQVILHRGPDDDGFFCEEFESSCLGMAIRRLSITDLTTGKQPKYSNDDKKVIVFDGAIFNYKLLRKDLERKGYQFSSTNDTEVVVNLYDCYGIDSFGMLDGMFALSIYDRTKNKAYIARDYFGEKPLYYCKNENDIYWASELKSITKGIDFPLSIDKNALNLYFQLTYIPAPFTIYNEVKKLEANHFLEISLDTMSLRLQEIKQDFKKYNPFSKEQASKTIHDLVRNSVASRSLSDVAIGAFLSGGVDSSIVSLCLAQQTSSKINTFSIGFDKKSFDETEKSQVVAKLINSNHHEFIISEKDLKENLAEILLNFDEPFADSSALASYVVANKTKDYVGVALTGDGGDEVFGGYNKYYIGKLNQKYTSFIPQSIHSKLESLGDLMLKTKDDKRGVRFKLNRLLHAINYEGDFYYNIISLGFQSKELEYLLKNGYLTPDNLSYYKKKIGSDNKTIQDFRAIDQLLSLEGDMLVKVDRTSMLTSLECRAPLLNKELWNYTKQLPESYLMNGWDKKHILKEAFKHYFPKGFLDKSKKGFGVPVGDWLRTILKEELLQYIDKKHLESQAIFNIDYIVPMVENHLNGTADNTFRVWSFYCFQKWYFNI